MARANECKECGKNMSQFFKGDYCGAACRQAKARRKRNSGKTVIRVKNDIRALIKIADDTALDYWEMAGHYNEIAALVDEFHTALNSLYERQAAAEARRAARE